MIDFEREARILAALEKNTRVRVRDMIEMLDVSESTVRRDFETLVKSGKAVYVYGGIRKAEEELPIGIPAMGDLSIIRKKDLLCKASADLIQDGMCVYVDGGTTFRTMMHYLKQKSIKVITNNVLMSSSYTADKSDHAEVILLGGEYDSAYYLTKGPLAVEKIQQFHFDYALIAAEAIDLPDNGAYVADINLASVKQAAMARSSQIWLVAESEKFNRRALYRFANLNQFTGIYSDPGKDIPELPMPMVDIAR